MSDHQTAADASDHHQHIPRILALTGLYSTEKPIYHVLVDTTFSVNTIGSIRCAIISGRHHCCASPRVIVMVLIMGGGHQHSLTGSGSGDGAAVTIVLVVGGAIVVCCWGVVVVRPSLAVVLVAV